MYEGLEELCAAPGPLSEQERELLEKRLAYAIGDGEGTAEERKFLETALWLTREAERPPTIREQRNLIGSYVVTCDDMGLLPVQRDDVFCSPQYAYYWSDPVREHLADDHGILVAANTIGLNHAHEHANPSLPIMQKHSHAGNPYHDCAIEERQ